MGSSRNAIMDNMMLVPEYDDYKQQRLLELVRICFRRDVESEIRHIDKL